MNLNLWFFINKDDNHGLENIIKDAISINYSKDFSFLNDENTINFIKNSKVMIINRGLPGSGKSTLSRSIKSSYEDSIVCSGDDYFMDSNGNYNFDQNLLFEAHLSAQKKADASCR